MDNIVKGKSRDVLFPRKCDSCGGTNIKWVVKKFSPTNSKSSNKGKKRAVAECSDCKAILNIFSS